MLELTCISSGVGKVLAGVGMLPVDIVSSTMTESY